MLFSEVIGQESLKADLREAVALNRVAHAYMFLGPEGSGKLPLALAFAQYLNCEHPSGTDACGQCPTCRAYAKLTHPDLHFIFPYTVDKKRDKLTCDDYLEDWRTLFLQNPYISLEKWMTYLGAEKKQLGIYDAAATGEENGRKGLLQKLSLSNYNAKYKVAVIWMAEKMNASFANKILKLVEEPQPHTLFLFIAESTQTILPTIISRTQIVNVPKIDDESLAQKIKEDFSLEGNELYSLVRNANGNYIRAFDMYMAQDMPTESFETFTKIMRLAWKKDVLALSEVVDSLASLSLERQKMFLRYCLRQLRENFARNQNLPQILYMDANEAAFAEKFHLFITENNVEGFYDEFNKSYADIARNGNAKMVFFDLFMRIIILLQRR